MNSTYIRTMYSPGFAYIRFSFYKTNLSLSFCPWVDKNNMGRSHYDMKKYLNTTISDENAAALYLIAKNIAEGNQSNPVQYQIQCNNQTLVSFEHDSEETRFIIEKNKDRIVFRFVTHRLRERVNGEIVTKTIQSGLMFFAKILQTYLTAIAEDRQQDYQANAEFNSSQQQGYSSTWR